VRLDEKIQEWIKERDIILEKANPKNKQNVLREKWKNYRGGSIIHLINFIRCYTMTKPSTVLKQNITRSRMDMKSNKN